MQKKHKYNHHKKNEDSLKVAIDAPKLIRSEHRRKTSKQRIKRVLESFDQNLGKT